MSELKAAAIRAIESLPESVNLERILEEIVYYAKVQEGLADIRAGRVKDFDEAIAKYGVDN